MVVCHLIMHLWGGLEAYQREVPLTDFLVKIGEKLDTYRTGECDKLFLMKMENNLEGIYMEGQGHLFTIDLIFFWISVPRRGVLWTVFLRDLYMCLKPAPQSRALCGAVCALPIAMVLY